LRTGSIFGDVGLEQSKGRRPDQLPPGRHGLDSRKTFYEHFDEKEECFLAAYDLEVSRIVEVAAEAFAGEDQRPWPQQIRDGVRAFLRYLAEHPAAARVCIVDVLGAGQKAVARRDAAVRSFTYFVDAGRSEAQHEVPGRLALGILGGCNELIAAELIHGSAANLERLAPELVYLMTLPFLGPRRAFSERERTRRELESQPPTGRRRASAGGDAEQPDEGRTGRRRRSAPAAKGKGNSQPASAKRGAPRSASGGRARQR
jgi:AcrR family transcriptional regulator